MAVVRANLVGGGDAGAEADAIAISLSCGSSVLAFLLTFKAVVGGVDGAGVSMAAVRASGPVTKEKLLGDPGTVPAGSPIVTSGGGGSSSSFSCLSAWLITVRISGV